MFALPLIRPSGTFSPWNGEKEDALPQKNLFIAPRIGH
jgi:hypothetical protein